MFKSSIAFSGFSVDDLAKAKAFYTDILDLKLEDESMGLRFQLPGGGHAFVYPKPDHQPATYTALNFVVDDIEEAVDELVSKGVKFEHYDEGEVKTDERGIARGAAVGKGPNIAWFKDPAGNILGLLEEA